MVLVGVVFVMNYLLWINGCIGGGVVGNYVDFIYWGLVGMVVGVNKKVVNWDGYYYILD